MRRAITLKLAAGFIALLAALTGCRREQPAAPAPQPAVPAPPKKHEHGEKGEFASAHEAEAHARLPRKIRLDPGVQKSAGIKTAKAVHESLPATVDLTGELASDPDRTARIAARVPGRVVSVAAKEGARVKAGDVIAVLDAPELGRARAALAAVSARARSARLNAERLARLESKSLAAGQEVASAAAEAAALEAEVAAAQQTVTAFGVASGVGGARQVLRAPFAGDVLSRDAVMGQTVDAAHVIAVVGDLSRAYFLGRLFEKDLAAVKPGAPVEVRLNAYPSEVFEGVVETVGKQLDAAARTVTARIVVKNHGDLLKVGLFGTARVVTMGPGQDRKRVVVPLAAVTRIADKDVTFVLQPDGEFEVHDVTLGHTAAGRVELLTGVRAGEEVVIDGVFSLKSAVLKGTFGEEEH